MKKKISIIAMVVVLIVCLAVFFTACGKNGGDDSGDASTINISNDYNYEQIEQKVNELAGANGVYVKIHVTESDTDGGDEDFYVAMGVKNHVYYFLGESTEGYFDLSNETQFIEYAKDNNVWTKDIYYYNSTYTQNRAKQMMSAYSTSVLGWFGYYRAVQAGEGTKTTTTFLNRSCDKYTVSMNYYGAVYNQEVIIDKATGICLKYSASASYGGEGGGISIECTEFNTSWNYTLPTVTDTNTHTHGTPSGGGQGGGSGEGGQGGSGEGGQGGSGEGGQGGGTQTTGYYITWRNWDNNYLGLDYVNAGVVPVYDGDEPTKPEDEDYTYEFIGWNPTPVAATAAATYTAKFRAHQKISPEQGQYFLGDSGKKFTIASISCDNATVKTQLETKLATAYLSIFMDGEFEMVAPHNGIYDVMLGTFTLSPTGTVATLRVKKLYDGTEDEYSLLGNNEYNLVVTYSDGSYTLPMTYEVESTEVPYTLNLSTPTNSPERVNIPADPNGGYEFDAQYQVTKDRWEELFNEFGYLYSENFTATGVDNGFTYTYEVENDKIHYSVDGYPAHEAYYKKKAPVYDGNDDLIGYSFDSYHLDSGNEWVKQGTELEYDHFTLKFGNLPIPFGEVTYAQDSHYYYYRAHSGTFTYVESLYGGSQDITNIRIYLSNGNISKITFKSHGVDYEYNYSNQGRTSVTLPTVESLPTTVSEVYALLQNKTFTYKEAYGNNFTADNKTALNTAGADQIVEVFGDNSIELSASKMANLEDNSVMNMTYVEYGELELDGISANNGDPYAYGTITLSGIYYSDVYMPMNDEVDFRFYLKSNEARFRMDTEKYIQYTLTDTVPTVTPHPDAPCTNISKNETYGAILETPDMFTANMISEFLDSNGFGYTVMLKDVDDNYTTINFKAILTSDKAIFYKEIVGGEKTVYEFSTASSATTYNSYCYDGSEWTNDQLAFEDQGFTSAEEAQKYLVFGMISDLYRPELYYNHDFATVAESKLLNRNVDMYSDTSSDLQVMIAVDQETGFVILYMYTITYNDTEYTTSTTVTSFSTTMEMPSYGA